MIVPKIPGSAIERALEAASRVGIMMPYVSPTNHYARHESIQGAAWAVAEANAAAIKELLRAAAPFIVAEAYDEIAKDLNCLDDFEVLRCYATELRRAAV